MTTAPIIERGREAFSKKQWKDAYSDFLNADKDNNLLPEDMEMFAVAAYLTGKSFESNEIWTKAHSAYLKEKDLKGAVRCAFWLGFILLNKGETAHGGGWISRANRIVDEANLDCVEKGYLLLPLALKQLNSNDCEQAMELFEKAGRIASQYANMDLLTLSSLGMGQSLIQLKKISEGVVLLDEAMANIEAGDVSPIVSGIVYCAVIEWCLDIFDLGRAHEWTEALSDWCEHQPHLVPFKGQCLIRRSEILQLHGKWSEAIEEAYKASEILSKPVLERAVGAAFYQLGELYRLKGEHEKAEDMYVKASKNGAKIQPGMSLLKLSQGQIESAISSLELAKKEGKTKKKVQILFAYAEAMLFFNNIQKARSAIEELYEMLYKVKAPYLEGCLAFLEGNALILEDDLNSALDKLFIALRIWDNLNAPYHSAKTRLAIGKTLRKLENEDAAKLEFEAALTVFLQLNAVPDIEYAQKLVINAPIHKTHHLTQREVQVLHLIVDGKSNKEIASNLFISERTVERHISNIFTKLNVSSRSAATTFAFKHKIIN